MEHSYKDSRHKHIPASSYPTAKEDLLLDLVEIFKATALTSSSSDGPAVHAEEGPAAHSQEEEEPAVEEEEPAVEEEEEEPVVEEEEEEPVAEEEPVEEEEEEEVEQGSSSAIVTPQKVDNYHDILAEEAVLLLSTPAPPAEVLDLNDLDNDDGDNPIDIAEQDILENDDEGGFESGEDW